jgi:hypothetical protein
MAAIYQWFIQDLEVLTTTLYPVEVIDAVQISADIVTGRMQPILQDSADSTGDFLGANIETLLINFDGGDDAADTTGDFLSANIEVLLINFDGGDDAADTTGDFLSANIASKLVTVDTPDEKLQLDCDVNPSGCSLDSV